MLVLRSCKFRCIPIVWLDQNALKPHFYEILTRNVPAPIGTAENAFAGTPGGTPRLKREDDGHLARGPPGAP
jgi:hypothetical protein